MGERSGGWYLTHGDGEVHGPYALAAIVEAAREGNISSVTQLRHATHTQDQWLLASRIRPVAESLGETGGNDAKTAAPVRAHPATLSTAAAAEAEPDHAPEQADRGDPDEGLTLEKPKPRRLGRGKHTLIVPQTFGAAVAALFDFRFRYFVTPWIIRVTWATCVVLALIGFIVLTYGFLIEPMTTSSTTGQVMPEGSVGPEVAAREGWQFQPPSSVAPHGWRLLAYGATVLGCGFGLLYLRMFFEAAIVLFRIATDLSELREFLKENS